MARGAPNTRTRVRKDLPSAGDVRPLVDPWRVRDVTVICEPNHRGHDKINPRGERRGSLFMLVTVLYLALLGGVTCKYNIYRNTL